METTQVTFLIAKNKLNEFYLVLPEPDTKEGIYLNNALNTCRHMVKRDPQDFLKPHNTVEFCSMLIQELMDILDEHTKKSL